MQTHKDFLDSMLANLSNTEDKSPNSFSYDILSAAAIVDVDLQDLILELFDKFDVQNLEGEDLESRVYQIAGIQRKLATRSTGKVLVTGISGTPIPKDTLFFAGEVGFSLDRDYTIPEAGSLEVQVTSLDFGGVANVVPGSITKTVPIIGGINDITNPQEIRNGYDAETDDDLRERYLEKLTNPPKAGNPAHYKLWATEVDGIWAAKVFRTWQGGGTVRVVVIGLDRKTVGPELLDKVRVHILEEAPIRYEGLTVESAKAKKMDIKMNLKLEKNADLIQVKESIREAINAYFYKISFRETYASQAQIGAEVLKIEGVEDYTDLVVTGAKMEETEVPELGSLEVSTLE